TSSLDSIPWIAANGINTAFSVHLAPDFDRIASFARRYWDEYAKHASDTRKLNGRGVPKVGLSVHIHVAQTNAQAHAQAGPAFEQFQHNYTYRFARRGNRDRYEARKHFDEEVHAGRIVVGSPATVRERLADFLERSGANYVIGCFAFGSLTGEQMLSSIDLFGREVMPALSKVREVSAA
ncbi:MAG: LLM class flavin-dependent oxidoreductase, partial [Chloroflexi bacterium]